MKSRASLCIATLTAAVWLAGCASGVKLNDQVPVESRTPTPVADAGAATGGQGAASSSATPQSQVASVDLTGKNSAGDAPAGLARVVYFDFDSFVVKDEFRPVLEGNARLLVASKQRHMVAEGHTDERGSREYNLALGQKRAEAVVRSLELLGAGASQLEAVSFGEERPAVPGSSEEAWAKNRRVELRDR